jgi:hypothetical protein
MESYPGYRRLDPQADDDRADARTDGRFAARRDAGVRQTRRISTWTAAALVASVAASAGYFAHAVVTPARAPTGTSVTGVSGNPGASAPKPSLTHPVVTSGGSGVVSGGAPGVATVGQWRDN